MLIRDRFHRHRLPNIFVTPSPIGWTAEPMFTNHALAKKPQNANGCIAFTPNPPHSWINYKQQLPKRSFEWGLWSRWSSGSLEFPRHANGIKRHGGLISHRGHDWESVWQSGWWIHRWSRQDADGILMGGATRARERLMWRLVWFKRCMA